MQERIRDKVYNFQMISAVISHVFFWFFISWHTDKRDSKRFIKNIWVSEFPRCEASWTLSLDELALVWSSDFIVRFTKSRRKEDLDRTDGFSMCLKDDPYHDRHFQDRLENFQPRPAKKYEVPLISFCFLFSSTSLPALMELCGFRKVHLIAATFLRLFF